MGEPKLLTSPMEFEVIRDFIENAGQYVHTKGKNIRGHEVTLSRPLGASKIAMNDPVKLNRKPSGA